MPTQLLLFLTAVALCCSACASSEKLDHEDMTVQQVNQAMQMIVLQDNATFMAVDNDDTFPPSLGHIALSDYSDLDFTVKPEEWPPGEPNDFTSWLKSRQLDWINANTDYVYLLGDMPFTRTDRDIPNLDADYVSFIQLPDSVDDQWVIICFMDKHYQVWSYAKADRKIRQQTGHSLAEWMEAESPGSGQIK